MKLEENMYIRTEKGIAKIKKIFSDGDEPYCGVKYGTDTYLEIYYDSQYVSDDDIVKASYNIIDLIEVGDYVNGSKVANIAEEEGMQYLVLDRDEVYYDNCLEPSSDKDIKSIVTHEQMEQMKYKVEV